MSDYDNFKKNNTPTVATKITFKISTNGTVRTIFKRTDEEEPSGENPPVFHTMIITLGAADKMLPMHTIEPNGQIIYFDKIDCHFLWNIPGSRMYEPGCNCNSWFYPMLGSDSWHRAYTGTCKHHTTSYKPPIKPQRKHDPDNGPWVGIRKKQEPLPIYEEALKILQQ